MYKITFSKTALNDIDNIINYIFYKLNNRIAALNLLNSFVSSKKYIIVFSKANKFNEKYYKFRIKNYYMFYTLDEVTKTITIVRVLYRKRNFQELLDLESMPKKEKNQDIS